MGLLQPERSGPGGRNRVYSNRDRTRLKLTLRAKRLGLSLTEARELIDMYDSPRDTGPQLLPVANGERITYNAQVRGQIMVDPGFGFYAGESASVNYLRRYD